jgi:hypothetical protein
VPFDRPVIDKSRPATTADLIALVDTAPGELDTDTTVRLDRAAVQPTADGDETELAGPVRGELDEAGSNQIDCVAIPPAHLHDPPPTGQAHHRLRKTPWHAASGPEGGDRFDQAVTVEPAENVVHGTGWVPPGVGDALDGAVDGLAIKINLVEDELVGVFRVDVPFREVADREVAEVGGDDDLSAGLDRCREDVSIVEVGELEPVDEAARSRAPDNPAQPGASAAGRARAAGSRSGRFW